MKPSYSLDCAKINSLYYFNAVRYYNIDLKPTLNNLYIDVYLISLV
jgi:hypothetical protein